jgi:sugar lactone lactonase YvrE
MALLSGGNCYGNIVPRQESGGPSTQLGNGTVAVLAPDGTLVREIPLRGKQPSNLTFGGPTERLFSSHKATGALSKRSASIGLGASPAYKRPTLAR